MIRQLAFDLWYFLSRPPWDTEISPPELLAFLGCNPAGRALDLGCGTGTNAITMANHGWEVVGVDFSGLAIRKARLKAQKAGVAIKFYRDDVSRLKHVDGAFDLVLDIGCFHSLSPEEREQYATNLHRLIRPAGAFLLYSKIHMPADNSTVHPSEVEINELFLENFDRISIDHGTDRGRKSAWFTLQRRA
jgi:cyclopropane fatty-acyl-phospholipid synthase-like methyltransferase